MKISNFTLGAFSPIVAKCRETEHSYWPASQICKFLPANQMFLIRDESIEGFVQYSIEGFVQYSTERVLSNRSELRENYTLKTTR